MYNKIKIMSLAAILTSTTAIAAPQYTISELPTGDTATSIAANSLQQGSIGGSLSFNVDQSLKLPALWQNPSASPTLLSTGDKTDGEVRSINASGEAVGDTWSTGDSSTIPVAWHNGQLQTLPTLTMNYGLATAINNQGNIVGNINTGSINGSTQSQAVLWSQGQATILGDFSGTQASATAINNQNQILITTASAGQSATWIWSSGTLTSVSFPNAPYITGYGLDDAGDVVGTLLLANAQPNGFGAFLDHNGSVEILPQIPGDLSAYAEAVNNTGEIVGAGYTNSYDQHPLLWENGQVYDLNTLIPTNSGWTLGNAVAVDDAGDIVGTGNFNGQTEAFMLTPTGSSPTLATTPEPLSIALLTLPLLTLLRRRSLR